MNYDLNADIAEILEEGSCAEGGSHVAMVHEALRAAILDVRLAPGRLLSDKEIAAHFNISKTPVREALVRLAEEDLVVVAPRSGTRVAPIDVQRFREGCFARLHLEKAAAMRAAEHRSDRDIIALRACYSRQQELITGSDYWQFFLCDEQFHELIFVAAGLSGLGPILKTVKAEVDRIRSLRSRLGIRRVGQVLQEHEAIISAIEKRDVERAGEALAAHLGDVDRKVWHLGEDHRLWESIEKINSSFSSRVRRVKIKSNGTRRNAQHGV